MLRPSATGWERFLRSPAISYVHPPQQKLCPTEFYWNYEQLEKWKGCHRCNSEHYASEVKNGVSSISYGALLLLASHASKIVKQKLLLELDQNTNIDVGIAPNKSNDGTIRIGLAIPEGPFLPLFVLVVHSLNVALGDGILFHPTVLNSQCKGVVLIPMETDEAPERLRHILADSDPDIILVAPGKDSESLVRILEMNPNQTVQLVEFTTIVYDALKLIGKHVDSGDAVLEKLFPLSLRDGLIDSLRYSHTIAGSCWDVARLVAWGCHKLDHISGDKSKDGIAAASIDGFDATVHRDIMSHVVYTSGTTGKPKGCVSSLQSLQHYIRAKNLAHGIECGKSKVLLASAITFDPCFSDILATFVANVTISLASRARLYGREDDVLVSPDNSITTYHGLTSLLRQLQITHVLCTPTLWATVEGDPPNNIPSLQVVALGGEPIPKTMRARWARRQTQDETNSNDVWDREYPRLYATYGVTEACVYQTCGEVVQIDEQNRVSQGLSVGISLLGTKIHVCQPLSDDDSNKSSSLEQLLQSAGEEPVVGEVVLSGAQVDAMSSYLNLPSLTKSVFIQSKTVPSSASDDAFLYRTGDLGYIHPQTNNLHILGRIKGDGMVKINGVRIELAEIESSLIDNVVDDEGGGLVTDCMASTTTARPVDESEGSNSMQKKQLIAYCILSSRCISELRIAKEQLKNGLIVSPGSLLAVLRERCDLRVRKGCTPSFFVIIDRLPLSPTGKRDRSRLPPLDTCFLMDCGNGDQGQSLWNIGTAGAIVAEKICECLNLQSYQRALVTRGSNFFLLGGDSLAATRVVRGLYALHHGVSNSRNLGGETGTLDGPFAAKYLLQAPTLGGYVDFLQSNSAFGHGQVPLDNASTSKIGREFSQQPRDNLYDSLLESISLGLTCIAVSLIDSGVDPNSKLMNKRLRLGKIKDRNQQRSLFHANPLHLACVRGEPLLVKKLLESGCKSNTPDAKGSFPIHLACSRLEDNGNNTSAHEDLNRVECVKMLLETTPISMRDGNKQTILHSAARSGHCQLLKYIIQQWKVASETTGLKFKSHNNTPRQMFDWYDRWFRTPVHWAVLNQRVDALRVLIEGGASAAPSKPKAGVSRRSTNVIIETPLEMCMRLYGEEDGVGKEISSILKHAI